MTTGGSPSNKRYKYCSFWVDHFLRFVYVTMHESKHASELIHSKLEFETFASRYQVHIKNIRADNGVYAAKAFQDSCQRNQQSLTFCAVGAHWQNGLAERFIGSITQQARTILLHAMSKWPVCATEDLWPFAVRHAVMVHNSSPKHGNQKSPYELFTNESPPWSLNDFRVFGSPVYVLQKKLQDGDSFNKWRARCWQGMYIGHSLCHASNVPLIYNPLTTHITPQFHIVHDEGFTSIDTPHSPSHEAYLQELYNTAPWLIPISKDALSDTYHFDTFWQPNHCTSLPSGQTQFKKPKFNHTNPTSNTMNVQSNLDPDHSTISTDNSNTTPNDMHRHEGDINPISGANPNATSIPESSQHEGDTNPIMGTQPNTDSTHTLRRHEGDHNPTSEASQMSQTTTYPHEGELHPTSARHPARQMKRNSAGKVLAPQYQIQSGQSAFQALTAHFGISGHVYTCPTQNDQSNTTCNVLPADPLHPTAFTAIYDLPTLPGEHDIQANLAVNNKDDTLTQSQMFKATDAEAFLTVQEPEIRGLEKMGVFQYEHISTLPPQARLLSSIWSYRRKRRPNGELLKYKARLCVDGSQQLQGRDFWETYAPVVSWSTVRLILLLSTIMNLKTRQVDYTQAFPQAELQDPVFMRIPQGWYISPTEGTLQRHDNPRHNDTNHYIRLKRNLYGCRQAAHNWFQHLKRGILAQGFHQSDIDPCLFLRSDCIMILYTDDTLIFAREDSTIDQLIKDLSSTFLMEDQGTVNDFLGIRISKDSSTRTITMTQPGLIESIIQDIGFSESSNLKYTPADSILHRDPSNTPRMDPWNYRSIIGKLNFLAQNTRPDISFVVHQCARFSSHPTRLHELAVKRIVRYLQFTADKGLQLHPTKDFSLNMYVDADFAGLWHQEFSALRENVLSRTGYIITYCNCPIHWASKLQSEIALSTTESEYIALSMATRELIPLRRLLLELNQYSYIHAPLPHQFNTTKTTHLATSHIYEDNQACVVLATSDQQSKIRTKHIAIKWHHFKDQIRLGHIKIVKVESSANWADILTKPLNRHKFETLRKLIMGW
jgi:hypothetical protein